MIAGILLQSILLVSLLGLITDGFDTSVCVPYNGTPRDVCNAKIPPCAKEGYFMKFMQPVQCTYYEQECVQRVGRKRICKTTEKRFNQDNGCQCANYCGYKCEVACSRDNLCRWNRQKGRCDYKTGERGREISNCRQPVISPTNVPTMSPNSPPTDSPVPPTSSPSNPTQSPSAPTNTPTLSPNTPPALRPTASIVVPDWKNCQSPTIGEQRRCEGFPQFKCKASGSNADCQSGQSDLCCCKPNSPPDQAKRICEGGACGGNEQRQCVPGTVCRERRCVRATRGRGRNGGR